MQEKYIDAKKLEQYLSLGREFIFCDTSPTKDITFPHRKVVSAVFHIDKASGAQSTLYVNRYGYDNNDTSLLNIDAYNFRIENNDNRDKIPLSGPSQSFRKSEYHHVDEFPFAWLSPQKYLDRLNEIRGGNLSDSNFL